MKGDKTDDLYFLQGSIVASATTIVVSDYPNSDITRLWRMHLGHMNEKQMSILSKQSLLCDKKVGKFDFCEHYIFGKQCKVQFTIGVHITKSIVNYIHSNIQDSSYILSKGGAQYLLTFIDAQERFGFIF